MISNFKLFPNFNISQNFVQNVQKQKNTFVVSCISNCFKLYLYYDRSKTNNNSALNKFVFQLQMVKVDQTQVEVNIY